MSDTEIAGTVRRLLGTLLDDHDAVQWEVEKGVVYLEGITQTATQKQRIDQTIRLVPGVRQVINCLALEHLADLHPEHPALVTVLPPMRCRASRWGGFGIS